MRGPRRVVKLVHTWWDWTTALAGWLMTTTQARVWSLTLGLSPEDVNAIEGTPA